MISKSKFTLSAAVIFFATLAAAQDSFPNLDTQKHCRARVQSVGDKSLSTSRTFDACIESEKAARDALFAAWKDIPPSYKASCVKPGVYSPSYAEWLACLELNIDVKKLRSKQ